jgi:hypothetical protein
VLRVLSTVGSLVFVGACLTLAIGACGRGEWFDAVTYALAGYGGASLCEAVERWGSRRESIGDWAD